MAAITWRNVNGPSLEGVSDIYRAAGESLNAGLGTLDQMLQKRNAIQSSNWDAQKNANTELFKSKVAGYKTPEELAAAEAELTNMATGFNGQVDPAVLRDYAASHLNTLRTRANESYDYDQKLKTRAEAPIIEQYRIAGLSGDNATQEALMRANPGIKWAEHMAWDKTQERQEEDYVRNKPNLDKQAQLTGLTTDQGIQAAEENTVVDQVVKTRLDAFNNSQKQHQMGIESIATGMGIPVVKGVPQLGNLPADKLTAFQAELAKANLLNPPSSSSVLKAAEDDLISRGVSAAGLVRGKQLLDGTVKADGSLSTEDQTKVSTLEAAIDAKKEEAVKSNFFYSDPKMLLQEKTQALSLVDAKLKDSEGTKERLRKKMSGWMETGMDIVKGGKKQRVIVSPKLVELAFNAVSEADAFPIFRNLSDDRMEEFIKDAYTSGKYDDLIREADSLKQDGDILAKQELRRAAVTKSGSATPSNTVKNLTDRLNDLLK